MCRVENHAISGLPHPIERTHVGNEVVIAETSAALRETEFLIAKRGQLLRDIAHVPRRKKLTFFYIDRATRFRSCVSQIGLAAKKSRNLQHIDLFAGNLGFGRQMNIRCDGDFQVSADG